MKKFIILFYLCLGLFCQTKADSVTLDINNTGYAIGFNTYGCNVYTTGYSAGLYSAISQYSGTIFDAMAACVANKKYETVIFKGPYAVGVQHDGEYKCVGANCSVTITYAENVNFYSTEVTSQTCTNITIKAQNQELKDRTVTLSNLNSPFIYTQNALSQNLQLTINSPLNFYQNQIPAFNINKGWQVIANQNQFVVNKTTKDYLFYELAMNKITLNRNGQNFSSQDELINYLQNSDFFTKLGLNEIQKANSLNYILPQLSQFTSANNYYLTILSDQAIQEISELNINPASKQLNRIYYAIYPTASLVKTNGDLIFPQIKQTEEFTVLETGEILVKPEMFVFWE